MKNLSSEWDGKLPNSSENRYLKKGKRRFMLPKHTNVLQQIANRVKSINYKSKLFAVKLAIDNTVKPPNSGHPK